MLYDKIPRKHHRAKDVTYDIDSNGCWNCTSHPPDGWGYSIISINGKYQKLHRVVYEIEKEPILKGNVVRHRCDNPRCFNPEHLEQGTQSDNMHDMYNRNRVSRSGFNNSRNKLKYDDVVAIKRLFKDSNLSCKKIAEMFNVHASTIERIKSGERYKDVVV